MRPRVPVNDGVMDQPPRPGRRSQTIWLAALLLGLGSAAVVAVLTTAGPVAVAITGTTQEPTAVESARALPGPESAPVASAPPPAPSDPGPVEPPDAVPNSVSGSGAAGAPDARAPVEPVVVRVVPPSIDASGAAPLSTVAAEPPTRGATMSRGVPVAEIDVDRLLALEPLRPSADSRHADGNGRFSKDGERMRFDAEGDWLSLMDRLSIPGNGDVEIAFEIEFDATAEGKPDVTAFWNAGPHESRGNGPITGSWSGYEMKLGGPGRDEMAFKEGGWAIVRDRQPVFTQGVAHQVEIRQQGGRVSVTVDGNPVLQAVDPDPGKQTWSGDQQRGFGLMFWHTSGWVGPIQIRTPDGNG